MIHALGIFTSSRKSKRSHTLGVFLLRCHQGALLFLIVAAKQATVEYVEYFLNPISTRHPSYVRDTYDFIEKIKKSLSSS